MEAWIPYFAAFSLLLLVEQWFPARRLPAQPGWVLKGALSLLVYLAVATYAPLLWDALLAEHRLVDGTALPLWLGTLLGLLVLELGIYAWHRLLHASPLLWRWSHQMHHSAERVDIAGAFYFHPLDMLGFTLVTSLMLVLVLGVSAEAAAYANLMATFCNAFQHMNIKTPRWLGYLVQRPENHALHHARGTHGYNYGDIALWDLVFGTFGNPAQAEHEAGFYDGASERVLEMLMGVDVSAAPLPQRSELAR